MSLLVLFLTPSLLVPVSASDWSMFRNDLRHSGHTSGAAPHSNTTLWNYTMEGSGAPSPAVADGMVFMCSRSGRVYALDMETGERVWNNTVGGTLDASPAVANDMVFVASGSRIFALDEYTGAQIWNYTFVTGLRSSPAATNGLVFAVDVLGNFRAFNQSTGAVEWSNSAGVGFGLLASSPAVADGMIFIGADYSLFALNETNGNQIWAYPIGDRIRWSSPAVDNGMVYVGAENNRVYCVNEFSGALVWNYPTGGDVQSSPAVADGVVFVGSYDRNVYALNQTNGALIWEYTTGGPVHSSPAVADGLVFIGSNDDKLYALDQSNGSLVWSYTAGGDIQSSPAIANGLLFVGSHDNKVYAFGSIAIWRNLDVDVSVGSPVFRGDTLDFYVMTSIDGDPIDASITNAILYYGNGTYLADLTSSAMVIALGIYKIPYLVPSDLANGSYYMIVSAHYPGGVQYEAVSSSGLCSFLVSSTLTEWAAWLAEINATLVGIQGSLAVVQSDIGVLMLDLASINASIISIQGNIVTIESDIGSLILDLASINASIISIQGTIVTIESDIGSIQVGLANLGADLSDLVSILEGWMIVTTELVVGEAAFDLQLLTNSTVDDVSSLGNVLTVTLDGDSNANGVSHFWIPKALLEEIGSSVEQLTITFDEEQADFTVAEGDDYYVITLAYGHNVDTITIYLEGPYPAFPSLFLILAGLLMTLVIAATCLVHQSKVGA